jgi:DNA-binding XRE family transcriptional regulator
VHPAFRRGSSPVPPWVGSGHPAPVDRWGDGDGDALPAPRSDADTTGTAPPIHRMVHQRRVERCTRPVQDRVAACVRPPLMSGSKPARGWQPRSLAGGNTAAEPRYPLSVEWTAATIRRFREVGLCLPQDKFATALGFAERTIGNAERGTHQPSLALRRALDHALEKASDAQRDRFLATENKASDERITLSATKSHGLQSAVWLGTSLIGGEEHEALELARRVAASDVGTETLSRLEDMVDELAVRYPITPPQELLGPVRRHVSYVMRLLDARQTLDEHRRLLIVGAWLSLIAATLYIDLEHRAAANSWLATAASLAQQAGQSEIYAWRYETEAWHVLNDGDYHHAVALSQAAQRLAPRGTSAAIQATAQEGRAWARLGKAKETYDALNRVERFVSRMAKPETPEHHYLYDPDKAEAYVATTLAWLGDVASEYHARHVVATLTQEAEAGRWPRRLASANIDLALALLLIDHLDEACAVAQASMLSGRLVASNHWRALEVVRTVEARGLPEALDLREAYELMRRGSGAN